MTARRFYGDDDEDEPMFRTAKQLGWRTSNDLLNGNLDELDGRRAITTPSSSRLTPLALPAPPSFSPKAPSLSGKLLDDDDDEDFPLHPKTPYVVLGVSKHASQDEIKRAYKKRALRYHPDLCRGDSRDKALAKQRFQLIAEAYAILGDATRRDEYDDVRRQRKAGRHHDSPASFKSSFVPTDSGLGGFGSNGTPSSDLRNIDPFYLFERIFGKLSLSAGYNDDLCADLSPLSPLSPLSGENNLLNDPLFPMSGSHKQKPINLHDTHQKAHIDRHGRLSMERSERRVHVSKNGGFSMESRSTSFSGSMGGSTSNFLQSFMQGGSTGERQSSVSGSFGLLDHPASRQRRLSFNEMLGIDSAPPSYSSLLSPSMPSFGSSSPMLLRHRQADMPLMLPGFSPGPRQSSSSSLIPRSGDSGLMRYGHGW